MNSAKLPNKHLSDSMDDKLQDYLKSIRKARFEGTFEDVVAWYSRLEKAEEARKKSQRGVYRWSLPVVKIKTMMIAAFVLIGVGFIPFPSEQIVGHLMFMSMDAGQEVCRQKMAALKLPHYQIVYSASPVYGQTYMVLLQPYEGETEANIWLKQVESDEDVELKESIEFKENVHRSLFGRLSKKLSSTMKSNGELTQILGRRKFHELASPYVTKWLSTSATRYRLNTGYIDRTLRYSLIPAPPLHFQSDKDVLFMQYNRLSMAIEILESEEPSVAQARDLLSSYRDSLELLLLKEIAIEKKTGRF